MSKGPDRPREGDNAPLPIIQAPPFGSRLGRHRIQTDPNRPRLRRADQRAADDLGARRNRSLRRSDYFFGNSQRQWRQSPGYYIASNDNAVNLKNRLGDVETDRRLFGSPNRGNLNSALIVG